MRISEIANEDVIKVIDAATHRGMQWATLADMLDAFPDVPYKIVAAKLRRMVSKGRIGGCACGCRGEFTRIPSGGTSDAV